MALSRIHRLTSTDDIQQVRRQGKTVKGSFFMCKFTKNQLNKARITVIVSTKVSSSAVIRNKLRRMVQSLFDHAPLDQSIDVVCSINRSILEKEKKEIKTEMNQAIQKIFVHS